jgi:8-oxo-dGTP diphosphatase
MISGTMCFLDCDESILFIYRKGKNDMHNGFYVPPGGHLERGERSIDCIMREFREETKGAELINPKLRVIATFYNKGRIMNGKKDPEDWRVDIYEANRFSGTIAPELVWIPKHKISDINMYEGDRRIMRLMNKNPGIFEAILQYDKEKLIRFDYKKVD